MKQSFFFSLFLLLSFGLFPSISFAEPQEPFITLAADDHTFNIPLTQIESWNHIEFRTLSDPSYKKEWENKDVCLFPLSFCETFLSEREQNNQYILATSKIQSEKIQQYFKQLKEKLNSSGTSSFIEPTENPSLVIFHRGEDGLQLAENENIKLLEDITQNPSSYTGKTTNLFFEKTNSTLRKDSQKLGLREKIGEGVSNFKGSSNNRIFNITHALKNFDAILIKPGEVFSFTTTLGPVDESTGYHQELIIRNNATEFEYGGGICQVSTTFFRAAVNTGLEILERKNHSYPVSYYKPIGFDATVYYPRPDLRIKNNFANNILFVPYIDGKDLHFEVYGTPDGRTVDVTLPVVTEKREDGGIRTQFTQTVKDAKGAILIKDIFKSNYDSPEKYPHPGDIEFTTKPKDWSKKQWEAYQKAKNP